MVAAGIASLYLGLHAADARQLQRANQLGIAGKYEEAAVEARRVARRPAETGALQVDAVALTAMGRYPEAVAAWRRVTARDPNSWVVHLGLARALLLGGDAEGASVALRRARALNPRLRVPDELQSVAAAA